MKKAILIIAIILAIILIFGIIKDYLVYLGLSILMALIVWVVGKTWGNSHKAGYYHDPSCIGNSSDDVNSFVRYG